MRFTILLVALNLIAIASFQNASVAQDIRIEAESGALSGFTIFGTYPFLSNGDAIQAPSAPGHTATYTFSGSTGTYDISVGYCDEDDGISSYTLSGSAAGPIASWQGDQPTGEVWCNPTSLLTREIVTSVTLEQGETITLDCQRDGDEPCRVDFFDFTTVSGADPAPDCIGEPADHPIVEYGQPRVFLEAQGWWGERLPDGNVPKYGDAEHLHIGACFPVQLTVSGTIRLDFRVVAHNAPLGSVIESTRFHNFNFDGSGSTVHEFDWNITVDEVDEIGWHTLYVDTTEWPDGLREARPFTTLIRPDGPEIHTSASWCWNVQNGQPDSNAPLCDRDVIQGRGWYNCFEYKKAETAFWAYPYDGVTAGADHFLSISGADGAPSGGEIAPQHYVRLNPSFHANQEGVHLLTHDGEHYNESLTIDGSLLTPGVHVLFVMTDDEGLCEEISPDTGFPDQIVPQDGEISGGIRIPILVQP